MRFSPSIDQVSSAYTETNLLGSLKSGNKLMHPGHPRTPPLKTHVQLSLSHIYTIRFPLSWLFSITYSLSHILSPHGLLRCTAHGESLKIRTCKNSIHAALEIPSIDEFLAALGAALPARARERHEKNRGRKNTGR